MLNGSDDHNTDQTEGADKEAPKAPEAPKGALMRAWEKVSGTASELTDKYAPNWLKSTFGVASGIGKTAYYLTSPVWWPTKKAVEMSVAGFKTGNATKGILATSFAGAALFTYLSAVSYGALYASVAAGDYYWFGQPYKKATVTGTISELGKQGKFPCDTIEGKLALPNLKNDGSSTFNFSVRRGFPGVYEKLDQLYKEKKPVDLDFKISHWPTKWFDPEDEGYWLPGVKLDFGCIQKTDTNIFNASKAEGPSQLAPKFPEAR
ncbi:MAG: hypothetical protein H6867_07210 [Rhodospirillales bacterium]|nr:hypothetical protein [Rhodospirillales bacterium]MCB9995339.1 hypothetical protein [Rhodospirillales bacterium]